MMGPNGASSALDPTEQTRCYSGKKKCHTVKNVLLINAVLTILFLSETYAGSTHDKRIADATPYPLPDGESVAPGSGLPGVHADHVEIIMPTKKPRGRALTRAQKAAKSTDCTPPRPHRARQQQREALPHRP